METDVNDGSRDMWEVGEGHCWPSILACVLWP